MTNKQLIHKILVDKDYDKLNEMIEFVSLIANHTDDAINVCDRMTSGNFMHHKSYIKQTLSSLKNLANHIFETDE